MKSTTFHARVKAFAIDTRYNPRLIQVFQDGTVRVWHDRLEAFTDNHALSKTVLRNLRRRAKF